MSYRKYLTRYGSPSDTAEIRCNIYLVDPAKIAEHKDIIWRDKITPDYLPDFVKMILNEDDE